MEQFLAKLSDFSHSEKEKCLSLMEKERREYVLSIRNEKRKNECICGEWLLKTAAAKSLNLRAQDIVIARSERGKPYLKGQGLFISLSHSGNFLAAVTHQSPVGIDIEIIRDIDSRIEKKLYTENDLETAKNSNDSLILLKIWTAKEAYFKMLGTGITDLKGINYKDINATHSVKDGLLITVVE